jgi:hypothetical protein
VEERQFKSQIDSKLDIVMAKVDQLNDRVTTMWGRDNQDLQVSSGISAQALLHTITRIVEDNERLGREVEEKVNLTFFYFGAGGYYFISREYFFLESNTSPDASGG